MIICKQLDSNLYLSANESLIVVDTQTENEKSVDVSTLKSSKKSTNENITSIDVSKTTGFILVATENKEIFVLNPSLELVKTFQINRTASKVRFTPQNDVLVADKTGDAYLYKLTSETNESVLLLGHLSMLLDVLLSECGKYIVTCDRDEKIRVSHYPNAYNIVSYCLGHTEFVTNLHMCDKILISASGDGTVRFWDYIEGTQLQLIDANEHVKEKNIKEQFCEEMNNEKVEINALPITDMQVFTKSLIYIAITLHYVNEIFLYSFEPEKLNVSFITSFVPHADLLSFAFTSKILALTTDGFYNFDCETKTGSSSKCLEKIFKKFTKLFNNTNKSNIAALYKRKYDNVQEYLQRKKMRLENCT